jgi:hypothetical protein
MGVDTVDLPPTFTLLNKEALGKHVPLMVLHRFKIRHFKQFIFNRVNPPPPWGEEIFF